MTAPFIVIDGADGAGKTTQMNRILSRLERASVPHLRLKFPQYGSPSAAPVEAYLRGDYGANSELSAKQASALFAVDRFGAKRTIDEARGRGTLVIADRFTLSNIGHQGSKLMAAGETAVADFIAWIDRFEHEELAIPRPDLNLVLSVPPEVSLARLRARSASDVIEADEAGIRAAAAAYRVICERYPNTLAIDCAPEGIPLSEEAVEALLWERISPLLVGLHKAALQSVVS